MPNKSTSNSLKGYIKAQLKRGYSLEQIKSALIKSGWDSKIIDNYTKEISKKPKSNLTIVILLVFFILIFSSYFIYSNLRSDINKKIQYYVSNGNALCSKGEYEAALQEFNKAISLNESFSWSYYNKAKCHILMGDYTNAILELNRPIRQYNKTQHYYFNLGISYCGAGFYEEGIANLHKAIQINISNKKFYQHLSKCYEKKGDIENSLLWLNKSESVTNS